MPFHASDDGTWRTFATRRNAEIYELACWLRVMRLRALDGDGTLLNVSTRVRERLEEFVEHIDSLADLRTWLQSKTNPELIILKDRVRNLPWLGRDHLDNLVEHGQTTGWATVRETASGEWAVPCWEGGGDPPPVWPDLQPLEL